jgi:uncharacterized protein YbbC (DUF1343 family)
MSSFTAIRNIRIIVTALFLITILTPTFPSHAISSVKVGAEVLRDHGYSELSGKRVGLVTNNSAAVGEKLIADLMLASGKVKLVAIFAPEHGFKCQKEDGVKIAGSIDELTGVPVYSLYGAVLKPTPEMMRGVDVLVFDIQGIGARFYTYISTMGLAMQAAAEMRIPFVVLDRPNPLGGDYVSGPVLEKEQTSFTGEYPIPIAHGMTIGELALMIKGERMLLGLENLELSIIKVAGWKRSMNWPETGLKWIRTSPNIPDFETALLYPGICLFEGTSVSVGRGTLEPFKLVGFPGINSGELAMALNRMNLPGVRFDQTAFTPGSIPGMSSNPVYQSRKIPGIKITITDLHKYRSVETGVYILSTLYRSLSSKERERFFSWSGFDHLAGTSTLRLAVERGLPPREIIAAWKNKREQYLEKRDKYLLY